MARNNEPALRRKTPLLICSMRTDIPYPWVGSRANVFRMSISSVPWTRSLGFSGMESLYPLATRGRIRFSPWLSRGARLLDLTAVAFSYYFTQGLELHSLVLVRQRTHQQKDWCT